MRIRITKPALTANLPTVGRELDAGHGIKSRASLIPLDVTTAKYLRSESASKSWLGTCTEPAKSC